MVGADLERRAHALVVVRRRQPDVDDRDVGRVAAHLQEQVRRPSRSCRRRRARSRSAARSSPSRSEHAVLGDHDAHGISARSRVPPPVRAPDPQPAVERLDAVGETAQARAALGVGAADSVVDDLDHDLAIRRASISTVAEVASACLPMFARLSDDEVERRDLERSRAAGRRARPSAAPAPGARAASCSSATSSPCPLTTAGWRPRATLAQLLERGRDLAPRLIEPRARARRRPRAAPRAGSARATSATSRCCAPSCRFRSSRFRSV